MQAKELSDSVGKGVDSEGLTLKFLSLVHKALMTRNSIIHKGV